VVWVFDLGRVGTGAMLFGAALLRFPRGFDVREGRADQQIIVISLPYILK